MRYDEPMIRHLTGKVLETTEKTIILEVSGVGYQIAVTPEVKNLLAKKADAVSLHTYLAVREDALDLYGFLDKKDLRLFELLISVSGIGPKGALGILSLASSATLYQSIISGNLEHLTNISGIGRKRAEKIILELKDKIVGASDSDGEEINESLKNESEAILALRALGYTLTESREALKKLPSDLDTKTRIKGALRNLGK